MDRGRWKKLIKTERSGWWVGECFFWYRLTRVVLAKGHKTVVVVVVVVVGHCTKIDKYVDEG